MSDSSKAEKIAAAKKKVNPICLALKVEKKRKQKTMRNKTIISATNKCRLQTVIYLYILYSIHMYFCYVALSIDTSI